MANERIIKFEVEGVDFVLPKELDNFYVRREDINSIPHDDYPDKRDVIQVSLLKIGWFKWKKKIVGTKLALRVYYDKSDIARAKAASEPNPFLLIHDGKKWHKVDHSKARHDMAPASTRWDKYMEVVMEPWEDPLISVGP